MCFCFILESEDGEFVLSADAIVQGVDVEETIAAEEQLSNPVDVTEELDGLQKVTYS